MSNTSRRNFLKFAGSAGVVSTLSISLPHGMSRVFAQQPSGMAGKVTITLTPTGRIHTYTAPAMAGGVTTHMIETDDSLILVDAQLMKPFGAEAAGYAAGLGKSIDRVILSHEHPDHWFGAENFDAPLVATETTVDNVSATINDGSSRAQADSFGDMAPTDLRTPEVGISLGTETINGLTFAFSAYENAEGFENLVVLLPDAQTAILQDLLYNGIYFFPGFDRVTWIAALEDLRTTLKADGYSTILPGHGVPTTLGALDEGIEFLTFLEEQFNTAESGQAVADAVAARYPSYDAAGILAFYPPFFPQS